MKKRRLLVWLLRLLTIGLIFGAWLYGRGPGNVSPLVLPAPEDVWSSLKTLVVSERLWSATLRTLIEVVLAGIFATVLGLLLGFIGSRTEFRAKVIEPPLVWGFMAPLILFYPIFLLWFGVGIWSKVGYATTCAFFPIAYNSLRAFSSINPKYIRMAYSFGATPAQIDREVKFRAGMPVVAAGLRVGLAVTLITVIVAEMISSTNGLGFLVSQSAQTFDPATEFALIALVMVLVGILQLGIRYALVEGHGRRRRLFRRAH